LRDRAFHVPSSTFSPNLLFSLGAFSLLAVFFSPRLKKSGSFRVVPARLLAVAPKFVTMKAKRRRGSPTRRVFRSFPFDESETK